jgi:hypothetical protein
MTTTIETESLFFGPGTITVDGVSIGQSEDPAKATFEIPIWTAKFQGRGTIKGTEVTMPPSCKLEAVIKELTAARAAWAFPGCAAVASACVGYPVTGLATVLAADPALGAATLDLTSVTTVNNGDFIRVAAAGVAATEANSEVVLVVDKGTAGGTDTDIVNDIGGGMVIDHANAAEVKTVAGTTLALDADAGATNIKVVAVTGHALLAPGDFIRVGYAGQYETRTIVTVGTIGAGGTGVTLDAPLSHAHAFGTWVIKVTSLGTTTITPAVGVIPDSAYHTVILRAPGADGVNRILTLRNARGVISGDLTFEAEKFVGVPVAFETTYDPADLDAIPFDLALA